MTQSPDHLPEVMKRQFQDLVEQAFSDDLHANGANWEDSGKCVDEHWEDLLDIMRQEITDRALDFIREQEREAAINEPHPSLSAAERNSSMR